MSDQERIAELEAQLSDILDKLESSLNTSAELTAALNSATAQLISQDKVHAELLLAMSIQAGTITAQSTLIKNYETLTAKLVADRPAPLDVYRFNDNRRRH